MTEIEEARKRSILTARFRRPEPLIGLAASRGPNAYPWVRYIFARGALGFLSLALEWLDAPPHVSRAVRQEARTG